MQKIGAETRKALGISFALDLLSPETPYGDALRRAFSVYAPGEKAALEDEWHNVAEAMEGLSAFPAQYGRISHLFRQVRDIRGSLQNLGASTLSEVELFEIKRFLLQLAALVPLLREVGAGYRGIALTEEAGALALLDPDGARTHGFTVGGRGAEKLTAIREQKRFEELRMRALPEGAERDAVRRERERLAADEAREELAVRDALSAALRPFAGGLLRNADGIGRLDLIIQKALLAKQHGCVRPAVSSGPLRFEGMEHPEVAERLRARGLPFTRVSVEAPVGATVFTGANMGGKSVAIRALAFHALWCQAGYFAFAERAEVPLFDAVFLLAEEPSDSAKGLSSFGAEVLALRLALETVSQGAFCLLAIDEPARGTNPREGAALAKALVRRLRAARSVSVVATHYDGVAEEASAHYRAAGLRGLPGEMPAGMSGEERLSYLAARMQYGLVRADGAREMPREALAVARALGLDAEVVGEMARQLGKTNAGAEACGQGE